MRIKRFLLTFVKGIIAVLIGLLISEALFRLIPEKNPPQFDRPQFLVGPARIKPYREKFEVQPPDSGVFRIVIVGDSFTWGANVQAPYTYASVFERLLSSVSKVPVRVYNFGVNGATTEEEIATIEKILPERPDRIIVGYFLNDPDPERELPPEIEPLYRFTQNPPWWHHRLKKYSKLYRYVSFKIWASKLTKANIRYYHRIFSDSSPLWKRHKQALKKLAQIRENTPLLVLIWPHLGFPMGKSYPFSAIHAKLHTTLSQYHIPYLDLLPVFTHLDNTRLQAVPAFDPHPSEIAHRIAGEALFGWFLQYDEKIQALIDTASLQPNPPIPSVRLRMAPLEPFFHIRTLHPILQHAGQK